MKKQLQSETVKATQFFLSWSRGLFSDELPQESDLDMVPSPLRPSSDRVVLKLRVYLPMDKISFTIYHL